MDSMIANVTNDRFYATQAKRLRMARAMDEYANAAERLRWMKERAGQLQCKQPDFLTDDEREYLKKYNDLKVEVEALYCMGTTGSYPPGYVPKPAPDKEPVKGW